MRPVQAVGRSHPDIKEVDYWKSHSHRDDVVVIEDLSMLQMAQAQGLDCLRFIYVANRNYRDDASKVKNYYLKHAKQAYEVSEKTMESLLEKNNQVGLIGVFSLTFIDPCMITPERFPLIVVLDRLEMAGNVGTILRTADATQVPLVIHVESMVSLSHPKLVSASRGMILFQRMARLSRDETIQLLRQWGYRVLLGEPEEGTSYYQMNYQEPLALVVGSERYGIHPSWFANPHQRIFIPMEGKMKSLNVGVAASILLYAAYTNHKLKK